MQLKTGTTITSAFREAVETGVDNETLSTSNVQRDPENQEAWQVLIDRKRWDRAAQRANDTRRHEGCPDIRRG